MVLFSFQMFTKYEGAVHDGSLREPAYQFYLIDAILTLKHFQSKLIKLMQVIVMGKSGKNLTTLVRNAAVCSLHDVTFLLLNMDIFININVLKIKTQLRTTMK